MKLSEKISGTFNMKKEEWLTVFIVALVLLYFYYYIFPRLLEYDRRRQSQ